MDNIMHIVKNTPLLRSMSVYTIFTTKENIENFKNDDKINIKTKKISTQLLEKILQEDIYYLYAKNFFTKKEDFFQVASIENKEINEKIKLSKDEIYLGLKELIKSKKNFFTKEEIKKFYKLESIYSLDEFEKESQNLKYKLKIDGTAYIFTVSDFIKFLNLDKTQYNYIIKKKIKLAFNTEKFIYALLTYIKETNLEENFFIKDEIRERIKELKKFTVIDIESINKIITIKEDNFKKININEKLKDEILKNIPENYNDLEKIIYIYIKMCKLLRYDAKYFTAQNKNKLRDYNNIENITLNNPVVICTEFNLIFSNLISSLNITFENEGIYFDEGEVPAHIYLKIRYNKFLINADSITSILQGDLLNAKLNDDLDGLYCENINNDTRAEFEKIVDSVYSYIKKLELDEDLTNLYLQKRELEKFKKNTIQERFKFLKELISNCKLYSIDSIAYLMQLKKNIFTYSENKKNVFISIIECKNHALAIITLKDKENASYYYLNSNNEIIDITKEEIENNLDNNVFNYIEDHDILIPNIIKK